MSDILQRFIFANFPVSGCIVRLDSSIKKIIAQHDYPENISMLLSEALAANLLMASTIKMAQSEPILSVFHRLSSLNISSQLGWTIQNNASLLGILH